MGNECSLSSPFSKLNSSNSVSNFSKDVPTSPLLICVAADPTIQSLPHCYGVGSGLEPAFRMSAQPARRPGAGAAPVGGCARAGTDPNSSRGENMFIWGHRARMGDDSALSVCLSFLAQPKPTCPLSTAQSFHTEQINQLPGMITFPVGSTGRVHSRNADWYAWTLCGQVNFPLL